MLPDHQIEAAVQAGSLKIEPFHRFQVQPASYDMRLGENFSTFRTERPVFDGAIDLMKPVDSEMREHAADIPGQTRFGMPFGAFALAITMEHVHLPADMVGRVEGKSSLARLGLFTHVTAGFIDPGFHGHITLELFCVNPRGLVLYSGMPICQVSFQWLDSPASFPYEGKYQHSDTPKPVESKFYKNFKEHGGSY